MPENTSFWDPNTWEFDQQELINDLVNRSTLVRYRTDAILKRSYRPQAAIEAEKTRDLIGNAPSPESLKRLVFLLNNCDVPCTTMVTLTMTPQVNDAHDVDRHKKALKAALKKIERLGSTQYCWVREFQANESLHWHIFCTLPCSDGIDYALSEKFSRWWAAYYGKHNASRKSIRDMIHGDGKGFRCVRVERLRSDVGGRYAGKEGAKRFQKVPPKKWCCTIDKTGKKTGGGGAWWRASYGMDCTPIDELQVDASTIQEYTFEKDGRTISVPYRIQFSKGVINESS